MGGVLTQHAALLKALITLVDSKRRAALVRADEECPVAARASIATEIRRHVAPDRLPCAGVKSGLAEQRLLQLASLGRHLPVHGAQLVGNGHGRTAAVVAAG